MVVLPDDSGPKISITRPRGNPPTPSAASNEIEPVEITETGTIASFDPRRRIEPLPNCFSIWPRAFSKARERSLSSIDAHCSSRYNQCRGRSYALTNCRLHSHVVFGEWAGVWRGQEADHRR